MAQIVCPVCDKMVVEYYEKIERLEGALRDIASGACCETPGCSADDPMCDVSVAKQALSTEDGG